MQLYQPTITGSLSVSGSINLSGSITIAGGGTISGTASIATNAITASSADNFLVRNTLTAQTLVVQTITSSVDFVTGSTRFGSIAANTHVFTGSMAVSGAAIFSEQLTATSPSTLFKEGFIVKATTTGGGGSQPAYTYYTAAGSKRWSSFLNVGDDKFHIANALNSEVFTIIQSGSVGIGTTDPLSKLHTVGSSTAVDNSGIMQISTGTVFASNKLIFGINDGNYAWIQAIQPDVAYRNLVLQSGGGNVSIGSTSNPGQKLYVAGDIRGGRLFTYSGGNATDPIIAPSDDTNNGIFFPSADTFAITTAGTERMRITSAGNVVLSQKLITSYTSNPGNVGNGGTTSFSLTQPTFEYQSTYFVSIVGLYAPGGVNQNGFYTGLVTFFNDSSNAQANVSALHANGWSLSVSATTGGTFTGTFTNTSGGTMTNIWIRILKINKTFDN